MSGKVILAGAGPGDPGLLTLKALEAIHKADLILFDQLVDASIRERFPPETEQIFVGKEGSTHYKTQEETISIMIRKAREGLKVLRLKGGDPFVFGRGGEEAEACVAAGIPFEVIPGITAGVAAPAYAGIPVTHRDASASVAFITGHRRGDREGLEIPTPDADTLVYYMGVKNLKKVKEALLAAGRAPSTPIALIHRGTTPNQQIVKGTLGEITAEGIKPPALIVVGKVVDYKESLTWFESKPLFGNKVLITRPRHQSGELRAALEEKGAAVVSMPAIEIRKPSDTQALDQAVNQLKGYHYLVFTSVNGVTAFFERLFQQGLDLRSLAGLTLVCIGPRTAKELERYHLRCDLMPKKYVAEELLACFPEDLDGKRILIPRALEAREVLPDGLRARGGEVDLVTAYQTVGVDEMIPVPEDLDAALFTSSSAVDHFMKRAKLPRRCKVAAIGPITAATLREHGLQVHMEAREHTINGLVEVLVETMAQGS